MILATHTLEAILDKIASERHCKLNYPNLKFNDQTINIQRKKFKLFKSSVKCIVCGIVGKYFLLEKPIFEKISSDSNLLITYRESNLLPVRVSFTVWDILSNNNVKKDKFLDLTKDCTKIIISYFTNEFGNIIHYI